MIARAVVWVLLVLALAPAVRADKHSDKKKKHKEAPAAVEKPAAPAAPATPAAPVAPVAPAAPAIDPHAVAKIHYTTAIGLIKTGQHHEAIAEFEAAYAAAALPNILYNIAQEYKAAMAVDEPLAKVEDLHAAVKYYRKYLDARKDAPDMIDVEKAVSELQAAEPAILRGAAKQHYGRAVELIKNDQHREAIAEFQRAFELAALPNILFNIAREYHALGDSGGEAAMSEVPDMQQAVGYYQKYLAAAKDTKDRVEVERAVAALQQRIERAEHPERAQQRPPVAEARPVPQMVRSFDENQESAPSVRRGRNFTIGGIALLAVGALLAAGGAVGLAIDHPNLTADRDFIFSFGGGNGISNPPSANQPLYIAGIAVGAAAALTGVALLVLGSRREKARSAPSLSAAPFVGNGAAGALLAGSF
jgi:tetratricopeptide (TPR) repeat protein